MNFLHNITLISFIFLAIVIFQCQTLDINLKGPAEGLLESLQEIESLPSQIIKNFDSNINSLSKNDDAKDQQKRQAPGNPKKFKIRPKKSILTRRIRELNDKNAEILQELYDHINGLRERHFAGPLKINLELVKTVQKYIDDFANNKTDAQKYNGPLGELFYFAKKGENISPLKHWTAGSKNFNFEDPENSVGNDDFTQLIWKSTTDIGCGISENSEGVYVYCRCSPKGNTKGEYSENISEEPLMTFTNDNKV